MIGAFKGLIIAGLIVYSSFFFPIVYVYFRSEISTDINTMLTIFFADVPVGLVLYVILERSDSKSRQVLDASEIVSLPKKYNHLILYYVDEYDDAEYPDKHYYVVNTKTNSAFWVTEEMQKLIEARLIGMHRKYQNLEALQREFATRNIKTEPNYPIGDDLFRD